MSHALRVLALIAAVSPATALAAGTRVCVDVDVGSPGTELEFAL